VPLVLHGSSGVADADMNLAIKRGMTKINVATHLNKAFTKAVREQLSRDLLGVDPRRYIGAERRP
jgi:fructose-bisphosphate aldolase, class II